VIVTGATGGIGRAIVGALGLSGCVVAACDVPGAPLTDVAGAEISRRICSAPSTSPRRHSPRSRPQAMAAWR
jgi:NAD(P)-dependent dehydrogenase (short-subunit alcohol dehydrogenase family)